MIDGLLMDIIVLAPAKSWYLEPKRVMLLTRIHPPVLGGVHPKPTDLNAVYININVNLSMLEWSYRF